MKPAIWKKIVTLVLLSATLLSLALPVHADVLIEPVDAFYMLHKDECEYRHSRQYFVNTPEGHAYGYVNPESDMTLSAHSNGHKVSISWYYTDENGETWGLPFAPSGWFRMSDLTAVYDSTSFIEEHGEGMSRYVTGTDTIPTTEERPAIMWSYPGKPSDGLFTSDDVAKYIQQVYTAPDGTQWGYISYYMGHREIWVCIADPYGDKAHETVEDIENDLKADPTPYGKIPLSRGNVRVLLIIGGLVGGVVLLTAAAIVAIFVVARKNKKKKVE